MMSNLRNTRRIVGLWSNYMKAGFSLILALVASTFLISGCDQVSIGGSDVVIIDLTAVAKATGQDEVIRLKAEAARDELTVQLQQLIQALGSATRPVGF